MESSTQTDQPGKLAAADKLAAWMGVLAAAITVARFLMEPSVQTSVRVSRDPAFVHASIRSYVIFVGAFFTAFGLQPLAAMAIARLRARWIPAFTYAALGSVCVFLTVFIVHVGRHQFGGFDYSILIEIGWRQWLGQIPYTSFPVATPPGFNLPIKYAYELFGVSWDANLYLSSVFACATFLWLYWLMRKLSLSGFAAAACAFSIESAAMLTLCFWWYNNSCLMMAAVFLLSCVVLGKYADSIAAGTSYTVSLAVLAMMKPNVAGVAIAGGVLLLFVVSKRRMRVVLFTLAAVVLVIAVFALNHISVRDMLANYLSVAKERGGNSTFGFTQLGVFEQKAALLYLALLGLPLAALLPLWSSQLRTRDWRAFGLTLLYPLAFLVACYGLRTNGDIRDVECTVLIAASAVVTFGMLPSRTLVRRYLAALLCGAIACNLYFGIARLRVYTIGRDTFFEFHDNEHTIQTGFLKNMRVGNILVETQDQITDAMAANPGSVYFGPRLDFNYATFHIPPPLHFPAWWHPGTAFGRNEIPAFLEVWKQQHFQTLIFLKDDYTFYPPAFMSLIQFGYTRDDRYPRITVYHRRPGS